MYAKFMALDAINGLLHPFERGGGAFTQIGFIPSAPPFSCGVLHIKEAFSFHRPDEESPSPKERVLHLIAGIFLLIPLINQYIFSRLCSYTAIRGNSPFRFKSISRPLPPLSNDYPCNSDPEAIQWAMEASLSLKSKMPADFDAWLERGKKQGYLNERFECFLRETVLGRFRNNWSCLSKIIEQGGDLTVRTAAYQLDNTILHDAIANAQNDVALNIIQCRHAESILNLQCREGNTPLHLAVGKGYTTISASGQRLDVPNLQLIQELLAKGANPNLSNHHGNTPLHLACLRRDIPTIRALLNHGADRTLVNYNGKRAEDLLHMSYYDAVAILRWTVGCVAFLLDKKQREANRTGALAALS